jgi:hypothetical protein
MNKYFCPTLFAQTQKAAPVNYRLRRPALTRHQNHRRNGLLCQPVPISTWQTHCWTKPIVQDRLDCIDSSKIRMLQQQEQRLRSER